MSAPAGKRDRYAEQYCRCHKPIREDITPPPVGGKERRQRQGNRNLLSSLHARHFLPVCDVRRVARADVRSRRILPASAAASPEEPRRSGVMVAGGKGVTEQAADRTPRFVEPTEDRGCQRWRCSRLACWNVWAGFYCYDDAILAGWLPGAAMRPGDQLELRA